MPSWQHSVRRLLLSMRQLLRGLYRRQRKQLRRKRRNEELPPMSYRALRGRHHHHHRRLSKPQSNPNMNHDISRMKKRHDRLPVRGVLTRSNLPFLILQRLQPYLFQHLPLYMPNLLQYQHQQLLRHMYRYRPHHLAKTHETTLHLTEILHPVVYELHQLQTTSSILSIVVKSEGRGYGIRGKVSRPRGL